MTALARSTPAGSLGRIFLILLTAIGLSSCGLNSVPTSEEQVNAAWANLQADYQRRNDLVGNLVETVKGAAKQESTVLIGVAQARAKATSVQLTPGDLDNPQKVQEYNQAQLAVTASVRPLMGPMIQERYPELKSLENFKMLQDQLEGTENRILVSRRDYNEAVRKYNTLIRTFPSAIGAKVFYGAKPKVPFEASAEAQSAPKVSFGG